MIIGFSSVIRPLSHLGRISQERLRREDISLARAKRYGEDKEIDDVNTEEYAADSAPALYWPDEVSVCLHTFYQALTTIIIDKRVPRHDL